MKYKASRDILSNTIPGLIILFQLGMFIYIWQSKDTIGGIIPILVLTHILIGCYIYAPQYYLLDDNNLRTTDLRGNNNFN
jgi:hypothetical protein